MQNLTSTAIHEIGHLVARWLLFGNIDTIKYVSLVQKGESLGRNKENTTLKIREAEYALDHNDEEAFFFNEYCYSYAGVIAEKEILGLPTLPIEAASIDLYSFESLTDAVAYIFNYESYESAAIEKTMALVRDNKDLILRIAEKIMTAPRKIMYRRALEKELSILVPIAQFAQ